MERERERRRWKVVQRKIDSGKPTDVSQGCKEPREGFENQSSVRLDNTRDRKRLYRFRDEAEDRMLGGAVSKVRSFKRRKVSRYGKVSQYGRFQELVGLDTRGFKN